MLFLSEINLYKEISLNSIKNLLQKVSSDSSLISLFSKNYIQVMPNRHIQTYDLALLSINQELNC